MTTPPPPPPPPPASGGPPFEPPSWQRAPYAHPPATSPPQRRRVWPWVVLAIVLLVGGCSAAVVAGAGWFVSTIREPVDVANTYLDEVRAGDRPTTACADAAAPVPDLARSTGQDLDEVEIVNRSADVRGIVTTPAGSTEVLIVLSRDDGQWCVVSTHTVTDGGV